MSRTSIPVDKSTKDRLDELKEEGETWDEFLRRVTSEDEPIQKGDLSDEALDEIEKNIERSRESFWMLFLDTSAILSYKREEEAAMSSLEGWEPWFTSSICLYEFVNGAMWKDGLSAHVARQSIGGVRSIDLNETVALEAARIQNELRSAGDEMAVRDVLIAATARSTGAELVVADSDFETEYLEGVLTVTNLSS